MSVHRRIGPRAALAALIALLLLAAPALADERGVPAADPPGQQAALRKLPPSMQTWLVGLEPELRRAALQRLRHMPPARRRALLQRWATMPKAKQAQVMRRVEEHARKRVDAAKAQRDRQAVEPVASGEAEDFLRGARRWRDMSPGERAKMRRRLSRFHALEAAQQRRLVARAFPDASESERERTLERLRAARPPSSPRRDDPARD